MTKKQTEEKKWARIFPRRHYIPGHAPESNAAQMRAELAECRQTIAMLSEQLCDARKIIRRLTSV